ncbi:MAG: exopolysaccharide biosynthesis polyprenyl glycosylphosphotransferase [Gammaproteobacteria bacterium]|nr:exopolysaccharide biosynthesis polyprenyl glycosylphosphotransferase [Gammaproteobacteria bacterium]
MPSAELLKYNKKNLQVPANVRSANSDVLDASIQDAQAWSSLVALDNNATLVPLSGIGAAFKRLEDFVLGSIALILLLPVMVIISIAVKLDSTGPALFCQPRSGRNREIIKVYKFRTMFQNGSQEFRQAQKDDPRITRVGAFLRKTSLDELPQLINVIQGSMSLVGPRPHPLKLDDEFKYVIPALNSRYCVKPGITGWAQINGFRGETRRVGDMVSRIEHDRHYIRHWSLWMDFKILVLTVFKGWTHKNAY